MSQAEKILAAFAAEKRVPDWFAQARDEVKQTALRNHDQAKAAFDGAAALERRLLQRVNAGELHLDVARKVYEAHAIDDPDYIADYLANQTYAYRFDVCEDESVVITYVVQAHAHIQHLAVGTMADTIGWHPTRAPFDSNPGPFTSLADDPSGSEA